MSLKRIFFAGLIRSLVMVPLVFSASPALADTWLKAMEGSWTGTGAARSDAGKPAKKIRCRIRGKAEGASGVKFSGRCASVQKRGGFSMTLKKSGSGSNYSANARSAIARGSVPYAGKRRSQRLRLTSVKTITKDGQKFRSRISLSLSGKNKLVFVEVLQNLTTKKTFESVRTTFRKK